ncbi:hypothetical protein GEV33_008585 [Tenebrio molitor]|uniref:Uncharacterized protein n=1 Tax=Tenebrio molitor TaxID=7067 RepID=A0A8J6LHY3_TENMO|nr:hypothetical protein GEV33_008585 [Tenebrio molitor]
MFFSTYAFPAASSLAKVKNFECSLIEHYILHRFLEEFGGTRICEKTSLPVQEGYDNIFSVIIVLAAGLPRRAFLVQRSRRVLSKTVEQVEHDNGLATGPKPALSYDSPSILVAGGGTLHVNVSFQSPVDRASHCLSGSVFKWSVETKTWPSMLQLTRIILVVTKHDENCSKMSRLSDVLDCILIINHKTDLISERLAHLSKERGSADNISVIVVFLREPSKIAAEAHWANRNASPITMDTSLDNANNPFANSNGADNNIIAQKTDGLLLNLSDNFKHNGSDLSPAGDFYHNTEKSNGKRLASEFDDDDDLGPETDVDAVDDVLSPSIVAAKALADGIVNNNPDGSFNPFVEKHEVEKAALEIDFDLQKQQSSEFDGQRSPREETPTPPADADRPRRCCSRIRKDHDDSQQNREESTGAELLHVNGRDLARPPLSDLVVVMVLLSGKTPLMTHLLNAHQLPCNCRLPEPYARAAGHDEIAKTETSDRSIFDSAITTERVAEGLSASSISLISQAHGSAHDPTITILIANYRASGNGAVAPDAIDVPVATDLPRMVVYFVTGCGLRLPYPSDGSPYPRTPLHDGGLEDNVGDSGEESEDEWNYIKGEEANKENISPSQPDCEVADILEEQENMSQLNPNAAEFVPVSPTRSIPSPACRALINDPVLAQSPKRPSEIDINLPNPQDFEKEVKSRPSDFDSFSNGHDHEGDQKSSSQELMENLLNGKNIDEIPEFQPGNTPNKAPTSDEFHFGPNAAPFTPVKPLDQSEAGLSTKAVFGDESTSNLDSTLDASRDNVDFTITMKGKEDDPMSMSFYQDKSGGDADPFDLNQVQVLPENLDDFLGKPDDDDKLHDDTISNVSKQDPARNLLSDDIILNNDERIQTTDLDRVVDDEKELASPVSNDDESSGVCELSKSPQPQIDELLEHLTCSLPKETLPDVCLRPESKSPRPDTEEFLQVESQKPQSPSPEPKVLSPEPTSPEPQTASPAPEALTPEPLTPALSPEPLAPVLSPEPPAPVLSPEPPAPVLSPEPPAPVLSPEPLAPVLSPEPPAPVLSPEPLEPLLSHEPQAPVLSPKPQELLLSPEPVVTPEVQDVLIPEAQKLTLSPEPQAPVLSPEPPVSQTLSPEPSEEICQISKSPVLQALSPEPSEEICSLPKTPEPEKIATPEPEPLTETVSDPIVDEICKFETEERKDTSVESPIEDITSSVKDVTSPISSPVLDQIEADPNIQLNFAQEINNAVQATMPVESSSPINEHNLVPDVCPISTPKSVASGGSGVAA